MDDLIKYASECRDMFGVAAEDFTHQEMQSLPAMRQKRFVDAMNAVEPSVSKMRHSFTVFGMLDSRADSESPDGKGMRRDLLADMRKFGEFGGVLAATCSSHCLRNFVLRSFRAVFVAALGIFARAQQLHSEGSKDILSPGVVWDALDDLHKLPKSDKNAFRRLILKAYGVVKDTADEFKEAAADVKRTNQNDARDEVAGASSTSQSEVATTGAAEAANTSFAVGDEVECQFEAELGGYEWFPGKIESVGSAAAPATFNILYDDGDREPNVKAKYVRQRGSGPALSPAAAALAAATGGGGSAAGMDLLSSMMEAMMQGVEDQYTPRDAAIVEDAVLQLRSVQKSFKVIADGVAKVPKVLTPELTKALDKLDKAVRRCEKATTDFGFSLYAPLKLKTLRENASALAKRVASLEKAASAPALEKFIEDYALHVAAELHQTRAVKVNSGIDAALKSSE